MTVLYLSAYQYYRAVTFNIMFRHRLWCRLCLSKPSQWLRCIFEDCWCHSHSYCFRYSQSLLTLCHKISNFAVVYKTKFFLDLPYLISVWGQTYWMVTTFYMELSLSLSLVGKNRRPYKYTLVLWWATAFWYIILAYN